MKELESASKRKERKYLLRDSFEFFEKYDTMITINISEYLVK